MPPKKKTKTEEEAKGKKEEPKEEKKEEEEDTDSEEESDSEDEREKWGYDESKGRGKRDRRSSQLSAFEPADFAAEKEVDRAAKVYKGRGKKLSEIPAVKENIEKFKASSSECQAAHRFLFTMRGKPALKDVKNDILSFSGYLKPLPKNYDEAMQEKEDDDLETKYSKKAFNMTVAQLRSMCDFFSIDRFSETPEGADKDTLVDYLLDFLGAPDPDLVLSDKKKAAAKTGGKKKVASPKKKKAPKKKRVRPPADPFDKVKAHKKGKEPSKEALQQWVNAYVVCFDMDQATTKHAIQTASEKFGVNMKKRKPEIKEMLAEAM